MTQLYQIFIQNSLKYINNKKNDFYFDKLIKRYINRKNRKYYMSVADENINIMKKDFYNTYKIYIIKPSHLKLFQPIEKKLNNQKGKKLLYDIHYFVKETFNYRQYLNENGIVKENKRIVYNDINISHKNDIKQYGYYITEEEIKENEKKNNNNKINEGKKFNKKIHNNNKIIENKNVNFSDDEEEELTNVEKEDIRDNIRGTLTRIFKSDKVNIVKDSAVLISSLEKKFGIKYFVDIIEGNKNSKEIKILSEDSFKTLSDVITKFLLKLNYNEQNLIYAIKVIKSSYYFKTIINKVDYLLNEKLFEKLTKHFIFFNTIHFWELWIEDELEESDIEMIDKIKNIKKEKSYHYIDEENEDFIQFKENYKIQIDNARKTMEIMKLNKSFMISAIVEFCKNYLIEEEFQKEQVLQIRNL